MPRGRTPKVSKERWAGTALRALSEGGVGAVRIEPLAKKLGVTKGSFYWHFENREELVRAALALWEERGTDKALLEVVKVEGPRERIEWLFESAFNVRGAGELIVRLAADSEHPLVAPVLERITEKRIAFVAAQIHELGLPAELARERAVLFYALYIGTFTLRASTRTAVPSDDTRRQYIEDLVRTVVST